MRRLWLCMYGYTMKFESSWNTSNFKFTERYIAIYEMIIMIFTIYQLEYNSKKFYSYLWYNIAWIANPNQSIVCHYKCMPYLRIITFNCSIIAIIKAHDFLFCLIYLIPHELWQQHTDMINTAYHNAPKDIFTVS